MAEPSLLWRFFENSGRAVYKALNLPV